MLSLERRCPKHRDKCRRMTNPILTISDWVPEMPHGYVRDLRVRWALEEAGLSCRVESVPLRDRKPEHFTH